MVGRIKGNDKDGDGLLLKSKKKEDKKEKKENKGKDRVLNFLQKTTDFDFMTYLRNKVLPKMGASPNDGILARNLELRIGQNSSTKVVCVTSPLNTPSSFALN